VTLRLLFVLCPNPASIKPSATACCPLPSAHRQQRPAPPPSTRAPKVLQKRPAGDPPPPSVAPLPHPGLKCRLFSSWNALGCSTHPSAHVWGCGTHPSTLQLERNPAQQTGGPQEAGTELGVPGGLARASLRCLTPYTPKPHKPETVTSNSWTVNSQPDTPRICC